ncbi:sensor domain-containing diguanylate cyclase [Ancylobacter mangrovi]|uniref:diguanylate cyclase n=1 Tax=Ancylobacter mangrovi TaxID=2972472 RepID=A0A9X2PG16_9HYPH|nr:sensor domain-containing diguanylate cyclase [Ancylobacter mangrovi]MCS0495345.1 sensor domain-containing diguanylate cyclase [Ancylobacter mangrovi]MCS0502991.1 sensor domain-containing diguanylate cyclase [Ancylobacter mangrovi]
MLHLTNGTLTDSDSRDFVEMFDLAPISLWLEDFSAVGELFATWRAEGVTSLRDHLRGHPDRVAECSKRIHVLKVNRRTLQLFEADSLAHLVDNIGRVFRDDMLKTHIDELAQLWDGNLTFASNTVNYTLSGQRLDIQLKGIVLPGYEQSLARVLLSVEDVTERETARRQAARAEEYARGLFEHSPISLWVEDFSSIKQLMDDVRMRGITDLRVFTDVHPEFVQRCLSEVRVIDVNQHTLEMFSAPSKAALIGNIGSVFRDDMHRHFREQLIELWNGHLFHQREVVNYTLSGDELHVHLQFSVLPGHEHDWSLVQIALTDITARKKAEAYLEYLGKHDVLTKLYNRSFYVDELNRLERKGPFPVTVIMVDLNDLKQVNDQLGHAAGDTLLRRAGEVLSKAVDKPNCAARIGGDEFAVLLPGTDRAGGLAVMENIEKLVELNNQFYSASTLALSMGLATSVNGERLEQVVKRADFEMYEAKRNQEGGAHGRD